MPDDLHDRAAAIFGSSADGVHWPYDVSGIDRSLRRKNPEAFQQKLAELTTKRYTIVEWAEHHGLKASRVKCCPLWLTRKTSRRCSPDSGCQRRSEADRLWLDHDIYWLRDSRPAVVTSAPYEVSDQDAQRLNWWHKEHPELRVERGEGWYGYGTSQIVMWNTTRIKYVGPAKNIDHPETFMRQA
jgi:hypothetical protein